MWQGGADLGADLRTLQVLQRVEGSAHLRPGGQGCKGPESRMWKLWAPPLAICAPTRDCWGWLPPPCPWPPDIQAFACICIPTAAVPLDPLQPTCCQCRRHHGVHCVHCACPASLQRLRAGPAPGFQALDKSESHNPSSPVGFCTGPRTALHIKITILASRPELTSPKAPPVLLAPPPTEPLRWVQVGGGAHPAAQQQIILGLSHHNTITPANWTSSRPSHGVMWGLQMSSTVRGRQGSGQVALTISKPRWGVWNDLTP
ncbi:hypothetical protein LEMLEM_LOCUS21144 [Lemmus lemmus]